MTLSTKPGIGQYLKPKISAMKPEVETGSGKVLERQVLAMRFQRIPHIFDYARLRNVTVDTA